MSGARGAKDKEKSERPAREKFNIGLFAFCGSTKAAISAFQTEQTAQIEPLGIVRRQRRVNWPGRRPQMNINAGEWDAKWIRASLTLAAKYLRSCRSGESWEERRFGSSFLFSRSSGRFRLLDTLEELRFHHVATVTEGEESIVWTLNRNFIWIILQWNRDICEFFFCASFWASFCYSNFVDNKIQL